MSDTIKKQHELFGKFADITIQLNMLSAIVQNPVEDIADVMDTETIQSFQDNMDKLSNDIITLKTDVVKHIESTPKTLHS